MPDQIFYSNIVMAADNQPYLKRPRLEGLLKQAIRHPLVVVTAGAGYGKTQTVYSFVRKQNAQVAWMQFSEQDNYPWRFWESFIHAAAFNDDDVLYNLAHTGFPETKRQFDRYIVIPEQAVNPERNYIFVYDDFHLIQDKRILRFMKQSVTSPFPNITSIIISRTEPDLDLKAQEDQGLVSRITEADLRFSAEELSDYYKMLRLEPDPGGLSELYRDTEGWAFAIHLVGLSRKSGSAATDYGRSSLRNNIFPLINSEVFSVNSPQLQKFLIKLSLIEHYPPELLAELTEDKNLIKELEQVNSFIRFDPYLNEYHIHHLFREFLSRRQGELRDEEKKEVYIKAARWFALRDMRIAAIEYFEKAGAYDELFDAVYTLPMIIQEHIAQFLLDLMDRSPRDLYRQYPVARIIHARMLFTQGDFDEALTELQVMIREYEALPPSAVSDRVLSGCYKNWGFISLITCVGTGQYDFPRYFEKAQYYYSRTPYETVGLRVGGLGSYVCRVGSPEQGEPERFIDAAARAIPFLAASMDGCYYGMDDLARAEIAYFRGQLDEAEGFALSALAKSRERTQYEIESRSLFYLIRICLAQGNYERLREVLKSLDTQLKVAEYVNRQIYYDIISGWFYIQIGQAAKLAPWLKSDFEESELNSLIHGTEILVRTKWYLGEKRYPAALAALAALGEKENPYGLRAFLLGKITMKVLEAVCLKETGEKVASLAALTEAYDMAEPNALDMCFIEIGKDTRTLMEMALREESCPIPRPWLEKIRRGSSAHAQKLFEAASQFRERRYTGASRGSRLSPREMAVLIRLSQGLTREEIAGDSQISINTVKSVIKSIYNKLGAVNLADAIRIAVSKGILKNNE
ncbi:MAG: LuxR C-terminal-related transcriptional regulator [Spirochaetaceae bacterium]|jgi:LuxR family maltose regulon positive regulatory protein|nr:LuxR C-terminal-related transcriptional regulator [Spirochaetaceae bacterium]